MDRFTEQPVPPPAAEDREALVVPFDPNASGCGHYANDLYQYVHGLVLKGAAGVVERKGSRLLVLLPQPIHGVSISSPYSLTFTAALLTELPNGDVDGWFVSSHKCAREVFDT